MIKVLFLTTVPATLRAFLLPFVRHFRNRGWQIDAMANGISGCDECVKTFNRVWEIEWSRNPLNPRNFMQSPRLLQELVDREKYDLVHVHTPVAAFITRYALRGLDSSVRPKVIYTAHGFHFYQGGPLFQNSIFLGLEKIAGNWTDYLVVINREDENMARRYGIVKKDRLIYIPGIGVDTKRYRPEAVPETEVMRVREKMGITSTMPMFLMVAEFNHGKRHRDALTAFARLGRPQVHLAFAGSGPLMEPMRQLAADLGISDRVQFLGFRSDVPTLIRASVATLLTSEREGLPRSVMESLCLGVPVIGTDIRGVRELLGEGRNLLVKVGDIEGLAQAMAWVLDHPKEALAMGLQGRNRMKSYDINHIISLHEMLYNKALKWDSYAKSMSY